MFNGIRKFFDNKRNEREQRYISNIIDNNNKERQNKVSDYYKFVQVVMYQYDDDNSIVPNIRVVCDFHGDYLPEVDSVIYAPDDKHECLIMYKVKRIDFMEDYNEEGFPVKHITMIVVDKMYE